MPLVELDLADHVANQHRDDPTGQQADRKAVARTPERAQQRPALGQSALSLVLDGGGLIFARKGGFATLSSAEAGFRRSGGARSIQHRLLFEGRLREPLRLPTQLGWLPDRRRLTRFGSSAEQPSER